MGMDHALGDVDECPRRGFEGALVQPKGERSLDHVVVLVLERVHVERCPTAVGDKVGFDHRERSPGFIAGGLHRIGVAEERSGLAFAPLPDNAAIGCFSHDYSSLPFPDDAGCAPEYPQAGARCQSRTRIARLTVRRVRRSRGVKVRRSMW